VGGDGDENGTPALYRALRDAFWVPKPTKCGPFWDREPHARGGDTRRLGFGHYSTVPVGDDVVFVDPWWDLRSGGEEEDRRAAALLNELRIETAPGHPLYDVLAEVIGACRARDDVVVRLSEGRFALVHLTYGGSEPAPWPSTRFFHSADEVEAEMKQRAG
jgi:hypothetical protein